MQEVFMGWAERCTHLLRFHWLKFSHVAYSLQGTLGNKVQEKDIGLLSSRLISGTISKGLNLSLMEELVYPHLQAHGKKGPCLQPPVRYPEKVTLQ